jgi:hypothetical protein
MAPPIEGGRQNGGMGGYDEYAVGTPSGTYRSPDRRFNGTGRLEISAGVPIGSQACTPPKPFQSPIKKNGVPTFSLDTSVMSSPATSKVRPFPDLRSMSKMLPVRRLLLTLLANMVFAVLPPPRFRKICHRLLTHAR